MSYTWIVPAPMLICSDYRKKKKACTAAVHAFHLCAEHGTNLAGAIGADGVTVEELGSYIRENNIR